MYLIYKKSGILGLTAVQDGVDLDQMLAEGRLPFGESDKYRKLEQDLPLHPLDQWGQTFLDSGKMLNLGDYTPIEPLQNITARQLRLALSKHGFLSRIEPALQAIPNDQAREEALIEWEYATEYHPNHALIDVIKASLGLTSEQFRTMWLAAVKL